MPSLRSSRPSRDEFDGPFGGPRVSGAGPSVETGHSVREFLRQHLEPADRLGEILFGLIMALGFTGAVRIGHAEADCRALFIHITGCNLAWAVVDGVLFVLTALFERGRRVRLARDVQRAPTEEAALQQIGREIDGPLVSLMTPEERRQVHRWMLAVARRPAPPARVRREDMLGGRAVALVIVLATLPVVVPFLVMGNPNVAVRVSNLVATVQLFLLGAWWGRVVGARPLHVGAGLTLVAVAMVLVTIVLGG